MSTPSIAERVAAGMDPEVVAEALCGPWEAVLADRYGDVMTIDDFDGNAEDPSEVVIVIVRRTAAPTGPDADGEKRLPGTYNAADHLIEFDDFEEPEEVEIAWVQAQAMAAGLNAAAEERRQAAGEAS